MKKKSWEKSLCDGLNDDAKYIKWLEKTNERLQKELYSLYGWVAVILLWVVFMAAINIWS
jgi:hypothetical protein